MPLGVEAIEIGNAMEPPVEHSMGIGEDELLRITLRVFRGERLTPAVRAGLSAGLRDAIARGRLVVEGDLIVRGEKD